MKKSLEIPEQIRIDLLQMDELFNPKWEFEFSWDLEIPGTVTSSPCFWNGIVFVNSSDGFIYAVDIEKKDIIWKKELTGDERDLPIDSSPAVSSEGILYVSSFKYIYSFDGKTGDVLKKTGGFFNPSPLLIKDEKIFVSQKSFFCAYNRHKLEKLWEFHADGYAESCPLIYDDMAFFGTEKGIIYALNIEDGNLYWEFSTGKSIEAAPSLWNDLLLIGSRDETLYALNWSDGTKKWDRKVDGEICCYSPVYRENVYVVSAMGNIYAFDVKSGKLLWETSVSGTLYSPPVFHRGLLYTGSSGRSTWFYVISPESGQVVWQFDAGGEIFASPCVGDDSSIFIVSVNGRLCSFMRRDLVPFTEDIPEKPFLISKLKEQRVVKRVRSEKPEEHSALKSVKTEKPEEHSALKSVKTEKPEEHSALKSVKTEELEEKLRKELQKKKKKELEEKLKARAKLKKEELEQKFKEEAKKKKEILEESLKVRSQTKIIDTKIRVEALKRIDQLAGIKADEEKPLSDLEKKLKAHAWKKAKQYGDKLKNLAQESKDEEVKKVTDKEISPADRAEKIFAVAKTQLEKKMTGPAIVSFRRALELMPDKVEYIISLADALCQNSEFSEGAALCEEALVSNPKNETLISNAVEIFLKAGDFYFKESSYDKAFEYYDKTLSFREDGRAYFGQSDIYMAKEDIPGAIQILIKGLSCNSRDFTQVVKLAELYSHIDIDMEDALEILYSKGNIRKDSPKADFLRGILLEEDDWDGAVLAYERAVDKQADFILPLYRLGILFFMAEEEDRAVDMFNRIIDIDPAYSKAYCLLGKTSFNSGDVKTAEEIIRKAILLDPDCPEAYCLLARILMKKNEILEAELCLEKVRGSYRATPEFRLTMGELFLRKKDSHKALHNFMKAINSLFSTWETLTRISSLSSSIEDYEVMLSLVEVFREEEYYDLLIPMYKRLIELNQEDHKSRTELAGLYRMFKKYESAVKLLSNPVKENPDNLELKTELAENLYRLAKKELDQGEPDRALPDIKSAINCINNRAPYHMLLGDIYFKTSKYSKALKAYSGSGSIEPENSLLHFKMGQAYEKLENYKEALKCYNEAVALDKTRINYIVNLTRVCVKLKHYRRAFSVSRKVLEKSPPSDVKVKAKLTKILNLSAGKLWLNFRFNGTAFQPDDKLAIQDLKNKNGFLNKKWLFATEKRIVASPVVSDRVVYTASTDGNLYSLRQKDGEVLWKFNAGTAIRSTPAIGKGLVYLAANDGSVYAVEIVSGKEIWSFDCASPIASSPLVAGDKFLFFGSDNGVFYGLSQKSGKLLWKFEVSEKITSSPVSTVDSVYFASQNGCLYCLDLNSGKEKWNKNLGSPIHSSPAFFNDFLYLGLLNNKVLALDASGGKKCWEYSTKGPVYSSPAVAYNKVFIGSEDQNIYALDINKGQIVWSYPTGGKILSSPAVSNGFVYVGSGDRHLYAIEIKTQRGYKFKTGGKIYSSPVIANKMLFVGSEDRNLYAFE